MILRFQKVLFQNFNKSIYQPKKRKIIVPSNPWYSDNYYKSDTVAINNSNIGVNPSLCNITNWTFYKKDAIIMSPGSYCKEPPTESATTLSDYYNLNIYDLDGKTYIELYNEAQLKEKFLVLNFLQYSSLSYINETRYTLLLKRIR